MRGAQWLAKGIAAEGQVREDIAKALVSNCAGDLGCIGHWQAPLPRHRALPSRVPHGRVLRVNSHILPGLVSCGMDQEGVARHLKVAEHYVAEGAPGGARSPGGRRCNGAGPRSRSGETAVRMLELVQAAQVRQRDRLRAAPRRDGRAIGERTLWKVDARQPSTNDGICAGQWQSNSW
jgi:hypothetical protein